MTFTPPFYLTGEAGKALGNVGYSLAALGVQDATLSLRSLDVDTLTFSLRDNGNRPAIPDDGQWLTLTDDTGQRLFTGIAKRSFAWPARIYSYEASNVYKALMETDLIGENGRPFVTYDQWSLSDILADILGKATAGGLPVQAPPAIPNFFRIPKISFRSSSIAGAVEESLKWNPSVASRMDYSPSTPTLHFHNRADEQPVLIDLDADQHACTSLEMVAIPEARALSVVFIYAERTGTTGVNLRVQQAGDDAAEARRSVNIYLSGHERTDMMVSEALSSASTAMITANNAVAVLNAELAAGAATAEQTLTAQATVTIDWTFVKDNHVSTYLADALTSTPAMVMTVPPGSVRLYNGGYTDRGDLYDTSVQFGSRNYNTEGWHMEDAGWYAVKPGVFTTEQLAAVGAATATKYIVGDMLLDYTGYSINSAPQGYLNNDTAKRTLLRGYDVGDYEGTFRRYIFYRTRCEVTAINVPISVVAAAATAATVASSTALIERAEYVMAPIDIAANYFAAQNWTPYKGSLTLAPSAPDFPAPGDFLSVTGDGTPAEWATMKVPVSELSLDLRTGAATIAIGPSPRMDFSSLVDRLRIPPEDNYQTG